MEPQMQYPPVPESQLPQWSRVGHLDKARYPKPFTKDQVPWPAEQDVEGDRESWETENPALRVEYLERSLKFLRTQHQELLSSLQTEVEKLRNENKELNFKLVMAHQGDHETDYKDNAEFESGSGDDTVLSAYLKERASNKATDTNENSKMRVLEQQVVELRHQVRELKSKNKYLSDTSKSQDSKVTATRKHSGNSSEKFESDHISSDMTEICITLDKLSVQPKLSRAVVVRDQAGSAKRRPNSGELERIVVHLYRTNEQLQSELGNVQSDLREVLYSHKWTPEAYLLAKAYVSKDGAAPSSAHSLPKIQMQNPSRKLPDLAYISRDTVSLPALKNTMGTKAAERRKRTQILQKARLHKEVL